MPHLHDPSKDSVHSFAIDLQTLRIESGNPTLVTLAGKTGVSKSVISDAFAGRRLPTQNTVVALVTALGGELKPWVERRQALDPRGHGIKQEPPISPALSDSAVKSDQPKQRTISIHTALLCMVAVALVSIGSTSIAWSMLRPPLTSNPIDAQNAAEDSNYVQYADGVDPMQTICREDATVAASEERLDGDVLVQMMYSNKCMAVWGRVTRYDGKAAGNSVAMKIYPAVDLNSTRNQERSAVDVQSIYTTLMIEPKVEARVCGIATVSQGDKEIELGPPICI